MKNGIKILLAAGIIGGGYLAYNAIKKAQTKPQIPDSPDEPNPNNGNNLILPPIVGGESLIDKIKKLQTILQVTADGVVGPITMGKIKNFANVTSVTSANIDGLIKRIGFAKPAVDSLIYNRNTDPARKRLMWEAWIAAAKKQGFSFDPDITRPYVLITGRSIYTDYANRAKNFDFSALKTVAKAVVPFPLSGTNLI